MGLFATYDLAGLEIAWSRRKRQLASGEVCGRYVEIADILCEHGRFGQKAGRGWYTYREGERSIDPEVTSIIEAARRKKNIVARAFTKSEIQKRLLNAMIIEGDALLREGVARSPSDIDIVMIYGFGFPAHKGGPMFAASTMT
ncbi:Fatty acid oxidation complex subunit alpha [compost metagenome]